MRLGGMASRALLGAAAAALACSCSSTETGVLGNGEFRYVCTSSADQACSGLANDTAIDLPANPVAVGATFQMTYAPNSGNGVSTVEGDNGYDIVPSSTEIALASGNTIKGLKTGYVTLFAQRAGVATIDDFVYVKFSPVASIAASPSSLSLLAGDSQQVTVAASDALGEPLAGLMACQWTVTSGSSSITLQTTTGGAVTVQGVANGAATLHVACGSASADVAVTVTGGTTSLDGGTNG